MIAPSAQRARSHHEVLSDLLAAARRGFGASWRPSIEEAQEDLGRGFLDACALALHVLWTYQEAWAEEGFLPTARLDESVDRLLAHLGYAPSPGTASVGLQHFRCRAGVTATLPPGFGVRSPARGDEPDAVFETLETARLSPDLNDAHAYLPSSTVAEIPSAPLIDVHLEDPGVDEQGRTVDAAARLLRALDQRRFLAEGSVKSARARQDERRLGDMMSAYKVHGGTSTGCQDVIKAVCKDLQAAKKELAKADGLSSLPGLTESQEILGRQLRILKARDPAAVAALDQALAKPDGEPAESQAERVAAIASFLDAFIASMVQDARDQVVLYHGLDALGRIDRAFGPSGASALGNALPGCDALFLFGQGATPGSVKPLSSIRPGDWLVLAEDVEVLDDAGGTTTRREYREAVRVVKTAEVVPPGRTAPHTRVTFAPPLRGAYDLSRTVVLGNLARVSAGATVEQVVESDAPSRIALTEEPLTYLRDPRAASGKRPEVRVFVGEREWTRVETLLHARPNDAVFVVERTPGGGARVRFGDGARGARPPADLPVRVRYRVGLGALGNRGVARLDAPVSAHPAIESTFNPLPLVGGTDPEPRAVSRARGPLVASAMDRAVSLGDVQALALAFGGVMRARVFREGTPRRSRVTVVVAGSPSIALDRKGLHDLRAHLAARVPPGVDIAVANVTLVPVHARILLRVSKGADPIEVVRRARLALGIDRDEGAPRGLLDPERVELGDDLSLSEVYRALGGIPDLPACLVQALHRPEQTGLFDRIEAGPREMLTWAASDGDGDGVAIGFEEAVDL